ncbi:hypothetical protein AAF712_006527 [Marasmius tenuissimus]|uniref:Uncharacterized protein n=1 Tax=Marasmius tenuissimus TaxID=585030 RepID=A0ABR2ZZC5_9AGAR
MFGFGKQESRKFIDLLLQVTNNKWANIDANKEIKVGDYGRIDGATGELQVEGNLYENPETAATMAAHPIREGTPTKFEKYTSQGVKELGISPSVNSGLQPFADVAFEGKWEFKNKRGALLYLITPRIHSMKGFPTSTVLDERFESILKNRVICTDVVSCPAFALYLANSKEHVFSLSLKADVPIPAAPGVTAGGGFSASWKFENTQGAVKEGLNEKGEYLFFPLYSLKQISWGKVASVVRGDEREESVLLDADIPWLDLDDEGEELDIPVDSGEPLASHSFMNHG